MSMSFVYENNYEVIMLRGGVSQAPLYMTFAL